jgi:nucleoside-diphosphate-sugar epimerase
LSVQTKPLVLITGSSGLLGKKLVSALTADYRIVGMDNTPGGTGCDEIEVDLTADDSVAEALAQVRGKFGSRIAAVLHLAAYYDFSGDPNPLYESLNVDGTARLCEGLPCCGSRVSIPIPAACRH